MHSTTTLFQVNFHDWSATFAGYRKLSNIPLPEGTTITILHRSGTVLTHQRDPNKLFGKSIKDAPFARMILERDGGTAESINAEGIRRLYAFTPPHQAGSDSVYVSVGIPRDIAYADLDSRFKRDMFALFLIVVIVIAVAWRGSNVFALQPPGVLAHASEDPGKGDLDVRTELPQTHDEFGRLAQTFDRMAASLQRRRDEAEIHDRELRRTNRALRTLSAGNSTLVRATDEPSLLQKMCSVAVELGGYRMAWFGFAEHDAEKTVRPVALAERTGMIRALTDWVLASALRQSTALRQADIHLPITVNLSAFNLQDPYLLDKVQEMCAANRIEISNA